VGLDDLAEEPVRAWLKALGEAVDHVPGGAEPAALLTHAGEHVPQRGPRAEGAFTAHEPGLAQPATLEITEHGSPAIGRPAIAVLDREQLLNPVLARADDDQQATASGPPQAGPGRGSRPNTGLAVARVDKFERAEAG
jgi:hypothetical protein